MNENIDNKLKSENKPAFLNDDDEKQKDPKKRREIIKTVLIVFLAVLLVLTFFSNTIMNRSLPEISTEAVSSGKLTERVRGSGMIESNQTYEVKVDGNKVIDTICIKTGQEVEKDTVLFTIGTGESEALTEAESALAALELEYQKSLLVVPVDYSVENQAIKNAREDLTKAIAKRDAAAEDQGSAAAAREQYNSNKIALNQKTAEQSALQSTITAIDTDDYSAAAVEYSGNLASLLNAYSSAESEYNAAYQLYTKLITEGADAAAAKEDADAKAVARDNAKAEYEGQKSSIRADLVNKMSYVNNDVEAKQRALEDLIINLEKVKKENNVNNQVAALDVDAKKAEIEKQKVKVEKLKKECESTEIKSKYSGVVSSINIKPGEETVPDMPIAVIDISSEGYTVQISVDGEKAKKVKVGAEAEVINNWNGNVNAVLSEIKNDTTSGSKNRILIFDITGDADSGTNLDLSIPCGSGTYDAIVPKSAVYEDKNGKFVLTVRSKSSPLGNRYYAERVSVEVIASDETSSAVNGDISSGDYVITAASKPVSPNDQVRMKD